MAVPATATISANSATISARAVALRGLDVGRSPPLTQALE
jgi:hypothetical protein